MYSQLSLLTSELTPFQFESKIRDYSTGSFVKTDFSCAAYAEIYETHMLFLKEIHCDNPKAYWTMMRYLFKHARYVLRVITFFII